MVILLRKRIQLTQSFYYNGSQSKKGNFLIFNNASYREGFDGRKFKFFCEVCEAYVSDDAKHCGACNRCVNGFDHHCRWLNNCVGQENYVYFFRLICAVFVMTLFHNASDIAVLIYANNNDKNLVKS